MSVANYITCARLFISPLFLLVYVGYNYLGISSTQLPFILLSILIVSEISDVIDGYIARRYNQVTNLGKLIDPMADSISRIAVFLSFTTGVVNVPIFLVFILIYRDFIISTLRTICALHGITLAARTSGKLKAILQSIVAFSILLLMIPQSMGYISEKTVQTASLWLVSFVSIYTIISGIEYIYNNREHIKTLIHSK